MDELDVKILNQLKLNARASASEISRQINLSVPAVVERIRKLEASGTIAQFTIKIDRASQGYHLLAFITVVLDHTKNILPFREAICRCPNVLECHHLAGTADYMLKVLVRNTLELEYFLMNTLKKIDGVVSSNTFISLSTLKEEINI